MMKRRVPRVDNAGNRRWPPLDRVLMTILVFCYIHSAERIASNNMNNGYGERGRWTRTRAY